MSLNKNALVGLSKLEKLCLNDNPISDIFPDSLDELYSTNPKCKVYVLTKCRFKFK